MKLIGGVTLLGCCLVGSFIVVNGAYMIHPGAGQIALGFIILSAGSVAWNAVK